MASIGGGTVGLTQDQVNAQLLAFFQTRSGNPAASMDDMLNAVFGQHVQLGTVMPPAVVATTGIVGTSGAAARADHTHASSVQRQRVTITLNGSTGQGVWTFPAAYAAGIVPVVETTVETPSGANYVLDAKIVAGSVSNTGCTVQVNKFNQSITLPSLATQLLGLTIGLFSAQTGSAVVHCWAAVPTA